MRALGVVVLLAAAACGSGGGDDSDGGGDGAGDATCAPGAPPVTIACPASVDLGCIPAVGVPGGFSVTASACDGTAPTVTCTPSSGEIFVPGETTVRCAATTATGDVARCEFVVTAGREGAFDLACEPAVTASCAGATTPVDVPEPVVNERCGALLGALISDAPAGGFPAGETTVTFRGSGEGGYGASCTTLVTVLDDVPPGLECPATATAVRTSPDGDAAAPVLEAADACEGTVAAAASPAALPRGTFPVTYTATDGAGNTATCTTSMTVLDAFAVEGLRIVSARLGTDGSTSVTLAWEPSAGVDATGYRVERAAGPDGPWVALGVVGAADLLFTDPALPGTAAWYRVVTWAGEHAGGVTGSRRALAIAAAGYDLRGQAVPTVGFATTLYGVVRHPVDGGYGPYPLVLLLHGNHGNCRSSRAWRDDECSTTADHDCHWSGYTTTPNAEGLSYLGETLAAHGYVTASLSGNALNCRDDYILERAELILEHLRRWRGWATTGGDPFGSTFVGNVDLGRVGLVGHSRGGEAVAHVPERIAATPISGVTVGSVFSIAPTDYHTPSPSAAPYAVLLPACDGDVSTLVGMSIYDRSLRPAGRVRSQVFFIGANHNYFSTEWRFDDNAWGLVCGTSDEVGGRAQRGMLEPTLAAWFEGTLPAGAELEGFVRADGDTPLGIDAWAGIDLDLRWSHAAAVRLVVDDLSGAGAPTVNLLGEANSFGGYTTARSCWENGCDADFDHLCNAMFLSWDGGVPLASWGLGGLDAAGRSHLSFRVVSRRSTLNDGLTDQVFLVRLADADGTEVEFPVTDVRRVPHLYPSRQQREVLQTVRVPLGPLATFVPALDLGSLERFELEMTAAGHARGSVLVTDLELTGR